MLYSGLHDGAEYSWTYLVTTDFELRKFLGSVPMCGASNIAKCCVEDRLLTMNVERNLELEELVALSPIGLRIKADV